MQFVNHVTPKYKPDPIPKWVYEDLAVRITQRLRRVVTPEYVKKNYWIMSMGNGRYKAWTT